MSYFLTPFLASRIKRSNSRLCLAYYDEDNFLHLTATFSKEIVIGHPPQMSVCHGRGNGRDVVPVFQGRRGPDCQIIIEPSHCVNGIIAFRLDHEYTVSSPVK